MALFVAGTQKGARLGSQALAAPSATLIMLSTENYKSEDVLSQMALADPQPVSDSNWDTDENHHPRRIRPPTAQWHWIGARDQIHQRERNNRLCGTDADDAHSGDLTGAFRPSLIRAVPDYRLNPLRSH
jgi:hypothetical protein